MNQIFKSKQNENQFPTETKFSLYELTEINSPAYFKKKLSSLDESDKSELKAQDIFDIGYLLLVAATGGLELLNQETCDSSEKGSCCVVH